MADNLDNRNFRIVSLADALPIGVNYTKPAWQIVYLGAPVRDWRFQKVGQGRYLISVDGYRYTGVLDGKVIASIHPEHEAEWDIVRQEFHNAYTITLARDPQVGWTVPLNDERNREILIRPIVKTPSFPPHFLPVQLFALEESDE